MSSSSVMNLAARAPGWVGVCLALAIVAITAVVATHRHTEPASSVPTAIEAAAGVPAPAAAADVRRERVSRSADRTRERQPRQRVKQTVPIVRKPIPTLPVAESNAAQTVAAAKASTYNTPGQCLGWSREQADIPSRYATAAIAWEHATGRHPGDWTPPKGAAVYWTGGSAGAGHIAISVGSGMVRSSDAGGSGVVATVSLRRLTREWGDLTYVGWADTINGYRIPGVARA